MKILKHMQQSSNEDSLHTDMEEILYLTLLSMFHSQAEALFPNLKEHYLQYLIEQQLKEHVLQIANALPGLHQQESQEGSNALLDKLKDLVNQSGHQSWLVNGYSLAQNKLPNIGIEIHMETSGIPLQKDILSH